MAPYLGSLALVESVCIFSRVSRDMTGTEAGGVKSKLEASVGLRQNMSYMSERGTCYY